MRFVHQNVIGWVLTFLTMSAEASGFKGYRPEAAGKVLIYTERIDSIRETEREFLIGISRHSAFYKFPKNVPYADQVKSYLNNRKKSKVWLIFEVDPTTAKILEISDVQRKGENQPAF